MDISIIIVTWNVKDLLRDCLQSLLVAIRAMPHLTIEIIVVDSASADGSANMVAAEFPQVQLIASTDNLGYAAGNNAGAAVAQGRYLFILNPDTIVRENTVSQLTNYAETHPTAGIIGPQLLWPDDTIQSSRRRFPTLGSLFWESTLLGQWAPHNRYIQHYHLADQTPNHPQVVDWVVGAALFIRRETWNQVGPIDTEFFMYFEETDWCHRAVNTGWQVHYVPAAQVVHYEGKSSEQVVAARLLRFQRSKLRYTQKYFGSGWATALHIFLWLTFAFQWAEETAKWLLGHRRTLRKERMLAYSQLLREL